MTLAEMALPPSGNRKAFVFLGTIMVVFTLLALRNLVAGEAMIPSLLWLGVESCLIWEEMARAGGWRAYGISLLGSWGKRFARLEPRDGGMLQFGFRFAGREFIRKSILVEKIESVEWNRAQGGGMIAWLWYRQDNPTWQRGRKPGQYLHAIGPEQKEAQAKQLAENFVTFLRQAGLALELSREEERCYTRPRIL